MVRGKIRVMVMGLGNGFRVVLMVRVMGMAVVMNYEL